MADRLSEGEGAGTNKLGAVKGVAQADHEGKSGKQAIELLHHLKNLPFDRVARYRPLGPAFGEKGSDHRFCHRGADAEG
jgi:hypothetical protein